MVMKRSASPAVWFPVLALFTFAPAAASSVPQWARVYKGEENRWIRMMRGTSEGGYVAVGMAGEDRLWLLKVAGAGNVLWEKAYEVRGQGFAVEQAPDGDLLAAGSTTLGDESQADVLVTRVGPSGAVRWHRAYGRPGDDSAVSIRRAGDGNYLVAATTTSSFDTGYQPWLLKIDPRGEILWQRRYGADAPGVWSMATNLEVTPDGGCILAADENRILKLDADGDPEWQKRYPHVGFGQSRIQSVQPAPGGGYVAAGYKPPSGESNMHAWVMRLDGQGNVLWQRGYRLGEVASWAKEVLPAAGGDFLVAGSYYAAWGDDDPFLMRLDPEGRVLWAKAYRRGGQQELASLAPAGAGSIAAGSTFSEPLSEAFILRVGPDGLIGGCSLVSEVPVAILEADAVATQAEEPWTATAAEPRAFEGAAYLAGTGVKVACADPGRLTVIGPNGGESVPSGGNRTLTWRAPPGAVDFNLAYSLDRGRTWGGIASHVPGTGHVWSLPIPPDNRRCCLVRVTGFDGEGRRVDFDRSDSSFVLHVVELTHPLGQYLEGGTAFTVKWHTFGTVAPVRSTALAFSRDGGATWEKLAELPGNPGSWVWRVPQLHTAEGVIRVRLKDRAGKSVGHDENDRFFRIYLKP